MEGGKQNWKLDFLYQPVYKWKKKKTICESNDKHREYPKDKHQDIKRDIEIIKYEEGE